MNREELQKLYRLEQTYWWFVGRRAIIKAILGKHLLGGNKKLNILDFGSGTGGNFPLLSQFGEVLGVEVSKHAINLSKDNFKDFKVYRIRLNEPCPFAERSFDLIALLDVLEHVENDQKLILELKPLLKKGGMFLLTVPAYQWLWSAHDEVLGHFRRYSRSDIKEKLVDLGLRIKYSTYIISSVWPIVVIYRLINQKPETSYVNLPSSANYFLIFLLKVEALLLKYIRFSFGTSVLILAQTNENGL